MAIGDETHWFFCFLPAGTAVLQLLTGRICGFSPSRDDTFHRLSLNLTQRGPLQLAKFHIDRTIFGDF